MQRLCKKCQTIFDAQKQQYLCPACREQAMHAPKIRPRVCRTCGAVFDGGSRAWYCPPCRAERQKTNQKKARESRRAGKTRQIGSQDVCQHCGEKYIVNAGQQKYCSVCAPELARQKKNQLSLEWSKAFRKKEPDYRRSIKENSDICVICGTPFTATSHSNTCSAACRKEQKRRAYLRADIKRGRYKKDSNSPSTNQPKSGIVGVTWCSGKWRAQYKKKYIGVFPTVEQAAQALNDYKASLPDAP